MIKKNSYRIFVENLSGNSRSEDREEHPRQAGSLDGRWMKVT
jgi:hypothetical protein